MLEHHNCTGDNVWCLGCHWYHLTSTDKCSCHFAYPSSTLQLPSPWTPALHLMITLNTSTAPHDHLEHQHCTSWSPWTPALHLMITLNTSTAPHDHLEHQHCTSWSPWTPALHLMITLNTSTAPHDHLEHQHCTSWSPWTPASWAPTHYTSPLSLNIDLLLPHFYFYQSREKTLLCGISRLSCLLVHVCMCACMQTNSTLVYLFKTKSSYPGLTVMTCQVLMQQAMKLIMNTLLCSLSNKICSQ